MGFLRSSRPVDATNGWPARLVFAAVISGLLLAGTGCAHHRLTRSDMGTLEASRVPPPAAHRQDTRFVVWGDSRSKGSQDLARESELRRCRRQLRDAILEEDIDFVINTGDMVESGREELWDFFSKDTGDLIRPNFFFPVLGNHEYKGDGDDDLRQYFNRFEPMVGNRRSYAFAHGAAYVIALDSFAQQYAQIDGLFDKIARAQLHGLDGEIDGSVAGDHHRIRLDAPALHYLQDLKSVQIGHLDVEQSNVDRANSQPANGFLPLLYNFHLPRLPPEQRTESEIYVGVIVCYQHAIRHGSIS